MAKKKEEKIYKSKLGTLIQGNSIELLEKDESIAALKVKVNFIMISPPLPLK